MPKQNVIIESPVTFGSPEALEKYVQHRVEMAQQDLAKANRGLARQSSKSAKSEEEPKFPKLARDVFNAYRKRNFNKSKTMKYELIAVITKGQTVDLMQVDWKSKEQIVAKVPFKTRRAIVRKTYLNHNGLQSDVALNY